MRVLLICYIYPPEVAPAGAMAAELAEHLTAQGHQVTVLTAFPNHPRGVVFDGYRMRWRDWEQREPFGVLRLWHTTSPKRTAVHRLLFYASFAFSTFVHGWAAPRPDVIFGITTPLVGGLAGLLLARLRRSRFIHVVWDVYPEAAIQLGVLRPGRAAEALRRLDTWICRASDLVAVLSQGLRNVLLARGLPEERVEVLPIWIDAEEVRPLPRMNAWRAEHGIPEDAFVVLYAGTIGLISGAEFLIEVAARVAARDAQVLFLLVGEGQVKDRIAEEAARRGLVNLRLLPFQPRERLSEVQATADVSLVTLLPGQGLTSVPSKVLGYMSAARPVIASVDADSDTAAWVNESGCGWVAPPQDVEALAEAVLEAKRDAGRRERMGRNGREFLCSRYSKEVVLTQYDQAFSRLVQGRPQGWVGRRRAAQPRGRRSEGS